MEMQVFEQQKFEDMDWSEKVMENIRFEKCSFVGVNFSESDLTSITFDRCKFVSCKFSVTNFSKCGLLNCAFKFCSMFSAEFHQCKTTGTSFSEIEMSTVTVNGGNWSYTNLRYCDFSSKKLTLHHRPYIDFIQFPMYNEQQGNGQPCAMLIPGEVTAKNILWRRNK